jgi:hypothetical protein
MKQIFDLRIDGEESGGPLGGTAPYKVILLEKCTVKEFVEYVLNTENTWGYIGIYNKEKDPFFGYPNIQYSGNKFKAGSIIEDFGEFLDKPVIKATADGGYGNMDYILYV